MRPTCAGRNTHEHDELHCGAYGDTQNHAQAESQNETGDDDRKQTHRHAATCFAVCIKCLSEDGNHRNDTDRPALRHQERCA